ncbi:hypothetical protein [Pedobacter sp. UBA4863]|uniref:hypothetical protein n=1 Tax=Pedobacter sp. UBA4863 TaxID=1947060 RepID=UPI0025FC0038|nr:hypothetical protein [Pedobacter sp. UBA4863]
MEEELIDLKTKLQSLGALRPEAWDLICKLAHSTEVMQEQRFVRKIGTLGYIAQGILKEYDDLDRSNPAIINFIGNHQCFITRSHQQNRYLLACMPCLVYHWNFDDLQKLYQRFNELRPVYEALCTEYEAGVLLRMRLLEMPVQERISAFRVLFRPTLPFSLLPFL